jgi:WhiB family transcriptional regulator, redox-sensing transcriptional regulator
VIVNSRRGPSPLVIILEQMTFFRNDARAACADQDHNPEWWFSDSGHIDYVRKVCYGCPLRLGCAEWAIDHERDGIWAGLTENDRKRIRHQREAAA